MAGGGKRQAKVGRQAAALLGGGAARHLAAWSWCGGHTAVRLVHTKVLSIHFAVLVFTGKQAPFMDSAFNLTSYFVSFVGESIPDEKGPSDLMIVNHHQSSQFLQSRI